MRKQTKLVAALSATALLAVGASMTSFAKGWTEIGDGEYVYLDSDGERVTSEWRRSGSDYFFLDENGEIAKSKLITPNDGDTDAYYYVNSVGARLKNQWVRVINEDDETVNDQQPEMFWYYLGTNGKAYRNDSTGEDDFKKYSINYAGSSRTFFFDTEGRMVTGWIEYEEKDGKKNLYYCTPDDSAGGYALTGWHELEVPDDWDAEKDEYDVVEWFCFDGNGKARRSDTIGKPKVWYSNGWYYSFDTNGVMLSDWYTSDVSVATSATASASNVDAAAFTSASGTKQGSGWIYTDKNDDGEYDYYYLVNYKDNDNKVTRNIPFNSFDNDGKMRAKAINGKIYLFDEDGVMKDDLQTLNADNFDKSGDDWGNISTRKLEYGTYYFTKASGIKGQMMYGKQKVEKDGEVDYYYFDKNTGRAIEKEVIDGSIYGDDGKMIKADDGNSNSIVEIDYEVTFRGKSDKIPAGSRIIVSSNGKVKTSTSGYTTVDGEKYRVYKPGKDASGEEQAWQVLTKEEYDALPKK